MTKVAGDDYLERWPQRTACVARWNAYIRRYLFWALAFEIGLYFRQNHVGAERRSDTVTIFEALDYHLSPEAFQQALEQLRRYRTGPLQYSAFFTMNALMHLKCTRPLAWATYHHTSIQELLGLR